MPVVRPVVAALLAATIAVPAAAQVPVPSAASDGWTLLHELPLNARVVVVNPMNDSVTGTVSSVADNAVVLTGQRYRSQWYGTRPSRDERSLTVRRADVSRVSVVEMPRRYKTPDERARPLTVGHFVSAQAVGAGLRVTRSDGTMLRGRLASRDGGSMTLMVDNSPTPVIFGEVREIERLGGWTTGRKVALIAGIGAAVILGIAAGLEY